MGNEKVRYDTPKKDWKKEKEKRSQAPRALEGAREGGGGDNARNSGYEDPPVHVRVHSLPRKTEDLISFIKGLSSSVVWFLSSPPHLRRPV